MAGQEQIRRNQPSPGPEEPVEPPKAVTPQINTSKVDSVLDEIDSVLETNAEDFVKNFVQKGGE
ncbi:ubiquitin-like protein Pup [Sediminivirga luteola]|uniref:Prokaryotic ubiquitin-like protein Pup n=1 Tax=Sediminivirga luteola TaxID=1774748 RepID=A0A8J2TWM2_9MICO|nr:ubiquitin-like protein Pup [Sediminivirga luteola]MCI2263931.1 ubiquitin-like protein Pup [Sediminivirga luteola]GGA08771.1 hypothetical protein GCM10011333_09670 [Sediminivirga luteola]